MAAYLKLSLLWYAPTWQHYESLFLELSHSVSQKQDPPQRHILSLQDSFSRHLHSNSPSRKYLLECQCFITSKHGITLNLSQLMFTILTPNATSLAWESTLSCSWSVPPWVSKTCSILTLSCGFFLARGRYPGISQWSV